MVLSCLSLFIYMVHCIFQIASLYLLGGKKKTIPFRRQRMEIDTIVPESDGPSRLIVPNPEDPYIADLLQVADNRIAELDREVRRLNDQKDVIERKVTTFREQVS